MEIIKNRMFEHLDINKEVADFSLKLKIFSWRVVLVARLISRQLQHFF